MLKSQEYLKQASDLNKEYMALLDAIGDADPSSEQYEKAKDYNKRIEELEEKAKERMEFEGLRIQANERQQKFNLPSNPHQFDGGQPESKGDQVALRQQKALTAGQELLSSKEFNDWLTRIKTGSAVSSAQFGTSPRTEVKTLLTGLSSTSGGAFVVNERLGTFDSFYARPLTVRDLVTNGQTNSDTVEYVRQGTVTNAAAPVAEATATGGSSGTKPESAMAFSIVTETVKTIAHWIPATRRALADAGQLRTLIDAFLRYGLEEELEDQMLTGDGTGENFTGILNVSGTQTQAFSTDILTTSRKARTILRTVGRTTPTAYVMNPNDWEDFDLLQDNEARYFFGGPSVLGNPRLWGVPVVESEAMTEGTAVLANWRFAVLWDREQANILVSDSHSDFFIRNMIAILAELRAAFGVIRPSAFVEIDLTP